MQVRDLFSLRVLKGAVLLAVAITLASCAQKEQVALVSDPSATGPESALPWNQQEKWEGQGQFGGMADRMNAGARR